MSKTKYLKNKNNKTIKRGGGIQPMHTLPVKKIEQSPQQLDGLSTILGNFAKKTTNELAHKAINSAHEKVVSFLNSPQVINGTKNALEIISKNAEKINDTYGTPETKKNIEEAVTNASEIASIIIDASKEPINDAVDEITKDSIRAMSEGSAGAVRVGTAVLGAVPGLGPFVQFGKIVNNTSDAISNISGIVLDATKIISKTKEQIDQNLNKITQENINNSSNEHMLSQQQKIGKEISNRTNKTMSEFINSSSYNKQSGGYQKTKRQLLKRKSKTKRVTFAI